MSKIDDGGTAFPLTGEVLAYQKGEPQFGMTLRDYFAAAALTGVISNEYCVPNVTYEAIVANSYAMADAMLAARKETQP